MSVWKYFCIIQRPGQPATRDCMTDYLNNINEKINKTKKDLEIKKRQKEGIPYHKEVIQWFESIRNELELDYNLFE